MRLVDVTRVLVTVIAGGPSATVNVPRLALLLRLTNGYFICGANSSVLLATTT